MDDVPLGGGGSVQHYYYSNYREYAKAAEMAFQNRSVEQLMEVQHKAARIPDVMDMIRSYQMKLGLKEMR